MADWEFEMNFAPAEYRKEQYKKAEDFEIVDEETAIEYIKHMSYLHYLHASHEIDNWDEMVKKENYAWNFIEDQKTIYEYIIRPQHHKIWKAGFDELRDDEKKVSKGLMPIKLFKVKILEFEKIIEPFQKEAEKYGFMKQEDYWCKNKFLQSKLGNLNGDSVN